MTSKFQSKESPIGYRGPTGGAVTQATNKTTAVTLNDKTHGLITMNNAALAAGAGTTVGIATFVFNNNLLEVGDMLLVSHYSGGTIGRYITNGRVTAAGVGAIDVYNAGTDSLSEAIVLKFLILKAPTAG